MKEICKMLRNKNKYRMWIYNTTKTSSRKKKKRLCMKAERRLRREEIYEAISDLESDFRK